MLKRFSLLLTIIFALMGFGHSMHAAEPVTVLSYVFPPFLNEDQQTGLIPDTVEALNRLQTKYEFILVITSPRRRYDGFRNGTADLIFYEMPEWGWTNEEGLSFSATQTIYKGGEKYISLKGGPDGQAIFSDFENKIICAYLGYHYGFADFVSDPKKLKSRFRISLVSSHEKIIERVLKGTAQIGVVTESYLHMYLKNNKVADKLLISDKYDQEYMLKTIVSEKSKIPLQEVEELLHQLTHDKLFRAHLDKQGLLDNWALKN